MITFRFDSTSCIAVGTFNMYVIQPGWLVDRGILPKISQMMLGTNLDEPGFHFSVPGEQTRWAVTPHRVEVSSKHEDDDCGKLVANVVRSLPWTPLKAVGCNFNYTATADEMRTLRPFLNFPTTPPHGYKAEEHQAMFSMRRDNRLYSVKLSILPDGGELLANAQEDINQRGGEQAAKMADSFFEHRERLEQIIRETLNVDLSYAG